MTNNNKLTSKPTYPKTRLEFNQVDEGVITLKNNDKPEVIEALMKAFGSKNIDTINFLTDSLSRIACNGKELSSAKDMDCGFAFLQEINPQDPIEAMLAIQMLGNHLLASKTIYRANLSNQNFEAVSENINRATKLSRTFMAQMEGLKKYRNKDGQKIKVEHVNINDGGKAVINSTINQQNNKS